MESLCDGLLTIVLIGDLLFDVSQITQTAQSILDARAKYPDVTFAQMYGDKMYLFPELVAAHAANDAAVMKAYGLAPDTSESQIVAHLFKLYADKVSL